MSKAIVLLGNIFDGHKFVGPFDDFDDAQTWAEGTHSEYLLATLEPPQPEAQDGGLVFTGQQEGRKAHMRKAEDGYALFFDDDQRRIEQYAITEFADAHQRCVTWLTKGELI